MGRMNRIVRIRASDENIRHRLQPGQFEGVFDKARRAIVSGDAPALQDALLSVELLSLELCEE